LRIEKKKGIKAKGKSIRRKRKKRFAPGHLVTITSWAAIRGGGERKKTQGGYLKKGGKVKHYKIIVVNGGV